MKDYSNAYAEAYTILNYLDENELNKIPHDVLSTIEENRNKKYIYAINEDLDLQEQQILPETKALLFNLFRDYLATPEQKQKIIRMQKEERLKNEEKKKMQYSIDVFANKKETTNKAIDNKEIIPVKYNKNLITKVIDFIKNLFRKI